MLQDEVERERAAVIAEAKEWLRTPYVPNARVKGEHGGADCLTFLADTYANAGIIERLSIPAYSPEWHLHQTAELYLLGKDDTPGVLHFCEEIAAPPGRKPLPADIVIFNFGHTFSHAAIVVNWPIIVHAWVRQGVALEDAERYTPLKKIFEVIEKRGQLRPRRFFVPKRWR